MNGHNNSLRTKLFISKSTPGDDAFVLWLAPRLEAAGYQVFADILNLDTGDRWRKKLTKTLQQETVKMLLCCSNETLAKDGVIEEIEIASDLSKSLDDPKFILPLRVRPFKKLFGIGGLQYTDFHQGWADGLSKLLKTLQNQDVPASKDIIIQSEWAAYQTRRAIELRNEPETLTSNWLRILSVPDDLYFIIPKGTIGEGNLKLVASSFTLPLVPYANGFISFASSIDFEEQFPFLGKFLISESIGYKDFMETGWDKIGVEEWETSKILVNLLRQAWEKHCKAEGYLLHEYSNGSAQVVDENKIDLSKRVPWGRQGQRRNSMLRNIARGKVWEYGVSARASLFPFPHYRLKGRVLFSEMEDNKKTKVIDDNKAQHRLRRSVCSGWRNKAWHGRLMAFMELLAGDSPYVSISVGKGNFVLLDAMPIQATSPVTARQMNKLDEDAEEKDVTTLGGYFSEDEE